MWSCGVILYILLKGSPPFAGKNAQRLIAAAQYNDEGLPRTAADLIRHCLVLDPSRRISAAGALQHPFFGILQRRATAPEMLSLMKKAETFRDSSRIRRAALTVLAMNANHSDEVERLRERFCEFDTDKNGFLDENEFRAVIESVGKTYSYAAQIDVPAILKAMDTDGSGRVDYMEFLAAALDGKMYKEEECRAAFQVFDKSKKGKIDKSDLAAVLKSDAGNEDGLTSLSFEEFHALVTGGVADGAFKPKPRSANGTNGTNGINGH
jgi:calcium-dependent protein kinase